MPIQNCKIYNCSDGGDMVKHEIIGLMSVKVMRHSREDFRYVEVSIPNSLPRSENVVHKERVLSEIKLRLDLIYAGDPNWHI